MAKLTRNSTSLKAGRPPLVKNSISKSSTTKQSSRKTRGLIRAHHTLQKKRAIAFAAGDGTQVSELDAELERLGGIDAYQNASLTGQSKDRGGDSSALLVSWLQEAHVLTKDNRNPVGQGLRILEVGALSSKNAVSTWIGKGIQIVKRIDLKSQEPSQIEEIDFMGFPVPQVKTQLFDIVSVSLVLNYVPDARGRGEMLKRTRMFLKNQQDHKTLPCLFFVLPLPCVNNSRYLTVDWLHQLMAALGYISIQMHQSAKLHYELYRLDSSSYSHRDFKKTEVNPGKGRNNYCITLDGG